MNVWFVLCAAAVLFGIAVNAGAYRLGGIHVWVSGDWVIAAGWIAAVFGGLLLMAYGWKRHKELTR